MRLYLEFAKKSFLKNLVYRTDYIIGVVNTLITIFVYVAIWKALYSNATELNGISFSMVATNFILSLAISSAFVVDDFMIARKVRRGEITTDLLKPINFNMYILSYNLGNVGFKLLMNFIPALLISSLFIDLLPPFSAAAFGYSIISVILGFFVLYCISYIIGLLSFWLYNIWSISTIVNVTISILSGTMIPLWFMPEKLINIIKVTPFDSIYFIPISIYLGKIGTNEVFGSIAKQLVWIAALAFVGHLLWKSAIKKLVLQGG